MAASAGAHAGPTWADGLNQLGIENFEAAWRLAEDCDDTECETANESYGGTGTNFDPTTGDPLDGIGSVTHRRVKPGFARVGDIIAGVLRVQEITRFPTGTVWQEGDDGEYFLGYFAQEIVDIDVDTAVDGFTFVTVGNAGSSDPFGILSDGEMLRMYVTDSPLTINNTTDITGNLSNITSGAFFGSFGTGDVNKTASEVVLDPDNNDTDGFSYIGLQTPDLGQPADSAVGFLAYDLVTRGPAYNLGQLAPINDEAEDALYGGYATEPVTGTCDPASGPLGATTTPTCTDLIGVTRLNLRVGDVSEEFFGGWQITSEDPIELFRIPVPGSLALLGVGLLGLGARLRRRA